MKNKKANPKKKIKTSKKKLEELRRLKGRQELSEHDKIIYNVEILCKLLRDGIPFAVAKTLSGITRNYYQKIKKDPLYKNLYDKIQKSKQEAHKKLVDKLYKKALQGDLKAIIFYLERRFPDLWASKQKLDIKSENRNKINLDEDTIKKILDLIKKDSLNDN
jgi:truncated hemoglobin YjbI